MRLFESDVLLRDELRRALTVFVRIVFFDYDGDVTRDTVYSDGSRLHAILTGQSPKEIQLLNQSKQPIAAGTCLAPQSGACLQAFDGSENGSTDLIQTVNGTMHVYARRGQKRDLLANIRMVTKLSTWVAYTNDESRMVMSLSAC